MSHLTTPFHPSSWQQCLPSPLAALCHQSCCREIGGGGRSWLRVVAVWFEDSLSIAGGEEEEEEEEEKEGEEKKEEEGDAAAAV